MTGSLVARIGIGPLLRGPGRYVLAWALAFSTAHALAGALPLPPGPQARPARPPAAVDAWDCWVDAEEGGGIRCIADRDRPRPVPDDYTDDDEAADVLLERVHDYLHLGIARRAGELVRDQAHLLRRDDLWTIRLHAPPLESSWRDARPEQLVRSLLCRGRPVCTICFHR